MATPQQDLDTIFAAWDEWIQKSNNAVDDKECEEFFNNFCSEVDAVAVANGRPTGHPTRKLG